MRQKRESLLRTVQFWTTLAFAASCGGGRDVGGPQDLPRETAVIIPTTDLGYETLQASDSDNRDHRDLADGMEDSTADTPALRDDPGALDGPQHDEAAGEDLGSSPSDPGPEPSCLPNCTGKVCGSDGCGGSCGSCKANEVCQGGACLCIPDCSGRECGTDGCGGSCAPGCAEGVHCLDNGKCAKSGPCSKHETLSCTGETSSSSNNNGWPPNSDVLDQYSCDSNLAHGPEKVYRFVPDQSGKVTWTLQGPFSPDPPSFLNLYLLADQGNGCTSRSCIAFDHRTLSVQVEAGRTYYVVVDAVLNNSASYYLTTTCSWAATASEP